MQAGDDVGGLGICEAGGHLKKRRVPGDLTEENGKAEMGDGKLKVEMGKPRETLRVTCLGEKRVEQGGDAAALGRIDPRVRMENL